MTQDQYIIDAEDEEVRKEYRKQLAATVMINEKAAELNERLEKAIDSLTQAVELLTKILKEEMKYENLLERYNNELKQK